MFVAFQVSAQDFHFLPKIGLNLANMTNSDGSMKPGLNVGVAAEFPINPRFSVEPGIYYSMQGVKESEGGISGKIKNDFGLRLGRNGHFGIGVARGKHKRHHLVGLHAYCITAANIGMQRPGA